LYNPASNTWSAGGSLPGPAIDQTSTLLASGKVLIAGGQDQTGNSVANAFIYDPATNAWSAAASMSTARTFHTATLLSNGKVLVLGGLSFANFGETFLSSAETYDPSGNSWSSAPDLSETREGHTATPVAGGQILVAGGDFSGSVELYATTLPDEIFRNGFDD
jgi:trimeric autotransporter adhesin